MKKKIVMMAAVLALAHVGTSNAAEKQDGCLVESVNLQCVENGVEKKVTLMGRDLAMEAQVDALSGKVRDISENLKQAQGDNQRLREQLQKAIEDRAAMLQKIKQIGSFFNGDYAAAGATDKEVQSPEAEKKSEKPVVTAPPQASQPASGIVSQSNTHIRTTPDKSAAVLATANKGDRIKVIQDVGGGWYKVLYLGRTGYVSSKLFTFAFD